MISVDFEGTNMIFENPDAMLNDTQELYLRGMLFKNNLGTSCVVTAWQPNKEEIEAINRGEPIYLLQVTTTPGEDAFCKTVLYVKSAT